MFNLFKKKTSYIKFIDTQVIPEMETLKSLIIFAWNNIYKEYPDGSFLLEESNKDLNLAVCAFMEPIFFNNLNVADYATGNMIFDKRMFDIGAKDGWFPKNRQLSGFTMEKGFFVNRISGSEIVSPIIRRFTLNNLEGSKEYLEYREEVKMKFGITETTKYDELSDELKKEYGDYLSNNIPSDATPPHVIRDLYNVVALSIETPYRQMEERLTKAINDCTFDSKLGLKEDREFLNSHD